MNGTVRKKQNTNEVQNSNSSLSERIYGFSWSNYFPLKLNEDEDVVIVEFKKAIEFIKENHNQIFDENLWGNPFFKAENNESKQKYYELISDCFLFLKNQKPYALIIGTLTDWSSYYLRYGAFLKEFQGGGRVQSFLNHIILTLKNNSISRVETDISPANLVNLHVFNKLQFNISGINLSERWGSIIHMTKFLNLDAERVFLDQFCAGVRPQLENKLADVIPIKKTKERGIL
jgi:hypothetical protein